VFTRVRTSGTVVTATTKIIPNISSNFLDFNNAKMASPAVRARYELREKVRASAIKSTERSTRKKMREELCFALKKAPIKTGIIKLKNPPTKFGSNHVERRRFWCGSQPSASYAVKSGTSFS